MLKIRQLTLLSLFLLSTYSLADGEQTYKAVCSSCHANGLNNAPKLGDKAKWGKLIKEGQAHITADGYHGVRAMPAKGGKEDLSLVEFSAAVVYMANQAGADWKDPNEEMLKDINRRLAKKVSK